MRRNMYIRIWLLLCGGLLCWCLSMSCGAPGTISNEQVGTTQDAASRENRGGPDTLTDKRSRPDAQRPRDEVLDREASRDRGGQIEKVRQDLALSDATPLDNSIKRDAPGEPAGRDDTAGPEVTKDRAPADSGLCAKAGESPSATKRCCPGLKTAPVASVPRCDKPSSRRICVDCGDAVCDSKKGENLCHCPTDCAKACQTQNDCPQKLACENSAQGCVQFGIGCAQGRCVAGKLAPQRSSVCNAKTGRCTYRCSADSQCLGGRTLRCQDAPGGCMYISARCVQGYCSFGQNQPDPKKVCNKRTWQCVSKGTLCQNTADCFPGGKPTFTCKPHPQGGCQRYSKTCYKGQCIRSGSHVRGYLCNPVTSLCAKKLCKSVCDCAQGQACVKGACATVTAPPVTYCCDNAGCPMGRACVSKSGRRGVCKTPLSCTKSGDCGPAYCENVNANTCREFLPRCQGAKCVFQAPATKTLSQCHYATGRCRAIACTNSTTCGKRVCQIKANECIQTTPTCTNKACQLVTTKTPTQTNYCDTKTGACLGKVCKANDVCGPPARCRMDKLTCVESLAYCSGSRCKTVVRRYPTDLARCDAKSGRCQRIICRKDGPCASNYCEMDSTHCLQYTTACNRSKRVCRASTVVKRDKKIFYCDTKTRQCLCNNPGKACGPPRCHISTKRLCYNVTYTCDSKGGCVSKSTYAGSVSQGYKCLKGATKCSR